MDNGLKAYSRMFTDYVNPDFDKINGKDNLVFMVYGMKNDCYSDNQVECELDKNFCEYYHNYLENKLTKNQICNLKRDFEIFEFDNIIDFIQNNNIKLLGNEYDRDRYVVDFLTECNFCSENMIAYLNWDYVLKDFEGELGIFEFNDKYYLAPELIF